jgi:hypothetical protein
MSTIMLNIIYEMDADFLIPYWSLDFGVMTFVNECDIVINLGEL